MTASFSAGTVISAASLAAKGLCSALMLETLRERDCLFIVEEGAMGCLMARLRFCKGARLLMSMSLGRPKATIGMATATAVSESDSRAARSIGASSSVASTRAEDLCFNSSEWVLSASLLSGLGEGSSSLDMYRSWRSGLE